MLIVPTCIPSFKLYIFTSCFPSSSLIIKYSRSLLTSKELTVDLGFNLGISSKFSIFLKSLFFNLYIKDTIVIEKRSNTIIPREITKLLRFFIIESRLY